jgi:hypothetical protein
MSARLLADFFPYATGTAAGLAEQEAGGFFILVGRLEPPTGPMRTRTGGTTAGVPNTLERSTFVHPIKRRPDALMQFVSVGRLDGNDVVFPDVTVSKFHAFLREVDGVFLLQDANSHNGTFVNDTRVAAQRMGPPVPLRNGDSIRFGTVQCSFVDAAGLFQLLSRRARS